MCTARFDMAARFDMPESQVLRLRALHLHVLLLGGITLGLLAAARSACRSSFSMPQLVQHGAHLPGRTIEGDPEACSPCSVFFFPYICSLLSVTGLWPSVETGRWIVLAAATEAAASLLSACGAAGFLVCARCRSGRGPAHSDHSARETSPGECPPGECPCCTRSAWKGLSNSDLTSNQHANGLPSACRSVS